MLIVLIVLAAWGGLGLWLQRRRPAWRGPWWGVSLLALATAAFSSPRISLVVAIFMAFLSAWSFFTAPILPPPPPCLGNPTPD